MIGLCNVEEEKTQRNHLILQEKECSSCVERAWRCVEKLFVCLCRDKLGTLKENSNIGKKSFLISENLESEQSRKQKVLCKENHVKLKSQN